MVFHLETAVSDPGAIIDQMPEGVADDFVTRCCSGDTPAEFVTNSDGELIMANYARDTFAIVGGTEPQGFFVHIYHDPLSLLDPEGDPVTSSSYTDLVSAFQSAVLAIGCDVVSSPAPYTKAAAAYAASNLRVLVGIST